jgi:hypothetical protein
VYLDADGDPLDPTTPDSEISKDNGAFADCAEEVTTASGSNGAGLLTLTGAETDVSMAVVCLKVASGPKATLITLYPRVLAVVGSGTLSAGSAGGGTLGTLLAYDVTGCFLRTMGGTGGGGTGGANNQARRIVTYNTGSGAFTVSPNWETTPDNTTTYDVLLPEGVTLGMLKALNSTSPAQTAGDIYAVVNTRLPTALSGGKMDAVVPDTQKVDVNTVKTQTVTCAAGVTVGAFVGQGTAAVAVNASGHVSRVTLTDTLTTYTGNTPQTGDNFVIVNSGSFGNAALLAAVQNVQNNTFIATSIPQFLERPDSGSVTVNVSIVFADETGAAKNLDASGTPAITLVNDAGTDRSSRLGAIDNPATGKYVVPYTSAASDAVEGLHWDVTGTVNAKSRRMVAYTQVVDTTAVSFTGTDRTNLGTVLSQVNKLTFTGGTLVQADVRDFGGTGGTFAAGRPEVNTTKIEGADATDTIDARVDARLLANGVSGRTTRPSGWPVSFHATAHNGTDNFDDLLMVWHDNLGDSRVVGGDGTPATDDVLTGGLKGRGGYYGAPNPVSPSYGLFGICFDGRLVLLLDDGGDFSNEYYGSYAWDGAAWADRQNKGLDPSSPRGQFADWDVTGQTITTSFTTYVGSDSAGVKAKTDNLPASPAAVGSAMTLAANQDVRNVTGTVPAVALTAAGLDAISVADPGAPANHTTLAKMLVAVWRALWKKETLTATQQKRYADNGTTVNATAAVADDLTTQSRGDFS